MKYVVFEAGSRAGFSAEFFYLAWKKNHPGRDVQLVMADSDTTFTLVPAEDGVERENDKVAAARLGGEGYRAFPGDELTRQRNDAVRGAISADRMAAVETWSYEKARVNRTLERLAGDDAGIRVPRTFMMESVCVKPNSGSAGSRGVEFKENVCVSELIDIKREYVVDVLEQDGDYRIYARETKLRCGYDKLVRLLPQGHPLVAAVRKFINTVNARWDATLFHDVFHLQIAENGAGEYYFIEASKRISGSAIVNIFKGFNPFDVLEGTAPAVYPNPFDDDRWYRFEDFVARLSLVTSR